MDNNEVFGDFKSASIPTIQPMQSLNKLSQNTNTFIIDNNILYKKLIEIEYEISVIKAIINAIPNKQPIHYPPQPSMFQPLHQVNSISQINSIPQVWTTPTNTMWKDNQIQFK